MTWVFMFIEIGLKVDWVVIVVYLYVVLCFLVLILDFYEVIGDFFKWKNVGKRLFIGNNFVFYLVVNVS